MLKDTKISLSFIIPVYNSEETLKECVDSILYQQKEDIEIIIVDDGSIESCGKLCDEIAKANQKMVKIMHKKNGGSLSARLAGIQEARGKYIVYVDSDDIILPGAIDHIYTDIQNNADLYVYDYIMDSVGGLFSSDIKILNYNFSVLFEKSNKKEISTAFMKGMMNTVCASVIRKTLIEKSMLLIQQNEKIKHGEDRLQKLFLLISADTIMYIPYAFYHYRWFTGTQGEDVRIGNFNKDIYKNFCITWPIERKNYSLLGFSKLESEIYDGEKLSKICSLFENAYIKKKYKNVEFAELVNILSKDELFIDLSRKGGTKNVRLHIRITTYLISHAKIRMLMIYWELCHKLRSILYAKR